MRPGDAGGERARFYKACRPGAPQWLLALYGSYFIEHSQQLLAERRNVPLDGLPHDFKIHGKIAMGNTIAHGIDVLPGNAWMGLCELGMVALDIARCLAHHLDVAYDGVLDQRIGKETSFIEAAVYSATRWIASTAC
jgi:hypothetical protein